MERDRLFEKAIYPAFHKNLSLDKSSCGDAYLPIDLRELRQVRQERHTLKIDEDDMMLKCPFHFKYVDEFPSSPDQEILVAADRHYACIFFKAELYYCM